MQNRDNRPGQAAELRRKAQEIARGKADQPPESLKPLSSEETGRMLHKLQVHQIELEMQNEELRKTQVELDATRARYFDLYDLAPVGYCTLSENGLIIENNLTAATLMGVARNALNNKPITRFIHKADQDIYYLHHKKLFETGMPQNCELRLLRPDGALLWAQINSTATHDATGAPACSAVIIDITEHRKKERRNAEISELNEKIIAASPLGIVAYDTAGQCIMANDAIGSIIGGDREDILRQNLNHLDSWKMSGLSEAAQSVLQTNQIRENLELHLVTTFGKEVRLNCCLIPFYSSGKPHLLLMCQDVSKQKLADEALRKSQKLASIGLLVAAIAHEINNPNGFIIFNLPILREYLSELISIADLHLKDYPKRKLFGRSYADFRKDLFNLLDNIEHGTQRINAIVSALKDFFRRQEKMELRRIDFKQLVDHTVSICQNEILKNVKSLQIDIPENLPPVLTDPDAIEQILVNLLVNAAHASDKEDSWIRLSMALDESNPDRRIIAISDNGCGMDEQSMKKIFDPFYADKSPMKGIGLGLYICQSLAEGLGCRIEVDSRKNQGSCFRVILNDRVPENRIIRFDPYPEKSGNA